MRTDVSVGSKILFFVIVGLLLGSMAGCATRISRKQIIDRRAVDVDLVREMEGLFKTKPEGFEHPVVISSERLVNILNAIEVETPQETGGFVREPAFYPDTVEDVARAIAEGFAEAGPDERLGVKVIRKEANLGLFHTKYLTSLLAYIKNDHLYILLSRVDWPIPQSKENDKLPEPRADQQPMRFRVVSGEHLFYSGPQSLEIDWQNAVFRTAYHLPGTSGGEKRRREVLLQAPIPKDERRREDEGGLSLDQLSPEQLRTLADLEEDRRQGRITEAAYQRAKRQILRPR